MLNQAYGQECYVVEQHRKAFGKIDVLCFVASLTYLDTWNKKKNVSAIVQSVSAGPPTVKDCGLNRKARVAKNNSVGVATGWIIARENRGK